MYERTSVRAFAYVYVLQTCVYIKKYVYLCMYVNQTKCVCARVVDTGTWRCRIFVANDDLVAAKQNTCDHAAAPAALTN